MHRLMSSGTTRPLTDWGGGGSQGQLSWLELCLQTSGLAPSEDLRAEALPMITTLRSRALSFLIGSV